MNNFQTYEHRDFYLGAYLIVQECELLDYRREHGSTIFVFEDNDDLQKALTEYYSPTAQVNPIDYSAAIRNLKSIIHNNRKSTQHISTFKSEASTNGTITRGNS